MRYLVILEQGPTSFGAYVPDLPGCIATGETREAALALIRDAIERHVVDLREVASERRRRLLLVKSSRLPPPNRPL